MGGNIFTGRTRRYGREEYLQLEDLMVQDLDTFLYANRYVDWLNDRDSYIQPIKAYHTKESFGDMDIILNTKYLDNDWLAKLVHVYGLGKDDWSKNGNVFSFVLHEFQIDLILTSPDEFETSLGYFAYNDCGNLVGRIYHKIGVKHGHRGLELILKEDDHVIGELMVTKDMRQIHELIGLDHDKWLAGFDTLEYMFEWVAASPYFNKDIYLLDNRNHYARVRDAKRKTYNEFLTWCENRDFVNKYPYESVEERGGYNIREPFYSDLIITKFPQIHSQVILTLDNYATLKAFKEWLNGNIVMELTGLSGKELGAFMTKVKEHFIKKYENMEKCVDIDKSLRDNVIRALYFCETHELNYPIIPEEFAINYIRGNN